MVASVLIAEASFEVQGRHVKLAAVRRPDGTMRYTVNEEAVSRDDFNSIMAFCAYGGLLGRTPPA